MNFPLRFLRDRFPFRQPPPTSGGIDALRRWRRDLGAVAPDVAATALLEAMPRLIAGAREPSPRLALLDALRNDIDALLQPIEQALDAAPLPVPPSLRQPILTADNLLKLLARGYNTAIDRQLEHTGPEAWPLHVAALTGATGTLARRQLLALRAGAAGSVSAWQRLHRLYELATRAATDDDGRRRVECEYLAGVLLAIAHNGAVGRNELPALAARCRYYATLVRIVASGALCGSLPQEAADGRVLIDVGEGAPRIADEARRQPATTRSLLLDCRPMLAHLEREIAAKQAATGDVEGALPPLPVASLNRLASLWRRRPTRRFARQSSKPRVDLAVGLEVLWWLLAGPALLRRRGSARLQGPAAKMSAWAVIDESPDGFGLRSLGDQAPPLAVGDLVAIRPRDHALLHIGLVRRLNASTLRLDIGVQVLGAEAFPVLVGAAAGGTDRCILLPQLPARQGAAGLIATTDRLLPGTLFRHSADAGERDYRIAEVIERTGACILYRAEAAPPRAA